jgi:hypothetical protein
MQSLKKLYICQRGAVQLPFSGTPVKIALLEQIPLLIGS